MGIIEWIKGNTRYKRFDDAFAVDRPSLWSALGKTIQSPQHADKSIWLVTHFTDTFSQLQEQLEAWDVDYQIVAAPIDPKQLQQSGHYSTSQVKLVLADLIPNPESTLLEFDPTQTIALIVAERHPQLSHDQRLEQFAKSLPCRVEFGYYLSLEDDVVQLVVNETTLTILRQLGLNQHELITSQMVTSRLNKVLRRISGTFTSDHPADSAGQWLTNNRA